MFETLKLMYKNLPLNKITDIENKEKALDVLFQNSKTPDDYHFLSDEYKKLAYFEMKMLGGSFFARNSNLLSKFEECKLLSLNSMLRQSLAKK